MANQESKVQDDQNKVNQDQTNINNTQNDIKNDQANVAQDQQNINNASQKVSDDQNQLNQDQSKLDQAQQTLQNDQNKVNDTQNQLNSVKDQLNNSDTNLNLPQNYGDDLKNGTLQDVGDNSELDKYGEYHNNPSDNYNVSIDNMTPEQQQEVTNYTAQLINSMREQIGEPDIHANTHMIDFTNKAIAAAEKDGYTDGHDPATGQIFQNDPDLTSEGENLGAPLYSGTTLTMNQIKETIYDDVRAMMLNDSGEDWIHSKILMNTNNASGNELGVGFDKNGRLFIEIGEGNISNDNLPLPSTDKSALQKQAQDLQNQLAQQKQQVANDQQTVNDLQSQVNADKEQIKNDTPTALQQKLSQDQKKLSDDQNKLNDLQKQLTQDQNQLSQDQAKLDELKKAQVSPEEIQKAQDAYNDAVKALNDAQSQMNKDSDTLAKAQQAYIDAQTKLNELETILKNDEKTVTTVDVQWIKHPHTTAEMGNKVVLSSSHQNTSSAVTMPTVNTVSSTVSENNTVKASSEVNNPVHADSVNEVKTAQATTVKSDDNSNVIYFTSEAPQRSVKKEAKQNTMPQMGDENSKATLWGEISLAMAGVLATLGLAKRKRHE